VYLECCAGLVVFWFCRQLGGHSGVLARRPTLLVDSGNNPQQTRKALGLDDVKGAEALVDQYIQTHALTAEDARQQIVSYVIPTETNLAGRGFDFLAGPVKYTPNMKIGWPRSAESNSQICWWINLPSLPTSTWSLTSATRLIPCEALRSQTGPSFLSWSMKTKHYSKSGQEAKRSSNACEKCKSHLRIKSENRFS